MSNEQQKQFLLPGSLIEHYAQQVLTERSPKARSKKNAQYLKHFDILHQDALQVLNGMLSNGMMFAQEPSEKALEEAVPVAIDTAVRMREHIEVRFEAFLETALIREQEVSEQRKNELLKEKDAGSQEDIRKPGDDSDHHPEPGERASDHPSNNS